MSLPDHLTDTNILVFSANRTSPFHAQAAGALESLLRLDVRLCVTPQNLIEFWNACTRPRERNGLGLSVAEADRETSRVERLLTLLPDNPAIYPEWRRLVVAHAVSGVQVHDARLVAAMNVYRLKRVLTLNGRDFSRYSGIRIVLPSEVLAGGYYESASDGV